MKQATDWPQPLSPPHAAASLLASGSLATLRDSCSPLPSPQLLSKPPPRVLWQDRKRLVGLPVNCRLLLSLLVLSCQSPWRAREKLSDCFPCQRGPGEAQTRLRAAVLGGGPEQEEERPRDRQDERRARGPGTRPWASDSRRAHCTPRPHPTPS